MIMVQLQIDISHSTTTPKTMFSTKMSSCCHLLLLLGFACMTNSGILRIGTPLPWNAAKPVLNIVRTSGIQQFINHYVRSKDVETPLFLWGDEVEYGLFRYDATAGRYDLSMRGKEVKELLVEKEQRLKGLTSGCEWQPEFGSWMVEAVPRDPYGGYISDLLLVEKNMQLRRRRLHAVLRNQEIAPSTGNFPMMGVSGYAHTKDCRGTIANSAYLSDEVINPHPRFGTLVRNIRARRQGNVDIRIPKADQRTITPLLGATNERGKAVIKSSTAADNDTTIHMDAMAFGMGCCCLQITMQARDDRESRFVHDQLATMAPLMLALSASTPIFKGQLAGTDTRWDVISQSVDDRTVFERGEPCTGVCVDPELVGGGVRRLAKSRYSSVSQYIGKTSSSAELTALQALNDIDANVDEEAYQMLIEGGIDESLASHIAHLFTRDPLVIFDDAIYLDDNTAVDHFENIQSTNWRTMRWKTPSLAVGLEAGRRKKRKEDSRVQSLFSFDRQKGLDGRDSSSIDGDVAFESSGAARIGGRDRDRSRGRGTDGGELGLDGNDEKDLQLYGPDWRVEFRPLEIQLTDFENAAFALLTVLMTRCMLAMGYNFYLPISLVEENMRRAQLQNAAKEQKFWVRNEAFQPPFFAKNASFGDVESGHSLVPSLSEITPIELTLNEFFNGKEASAIDRVAGRQGDGFPGLIPAIYGYLEALGCDTLTIGRLSPYLTLLQKRASGELLTTAQWIRQFVRSHPVYEGDGVVSSRVADDLLVRCEDIGMGRVACPELLGDAFVEKLCVTDVSEPYLHSSLKNATATDSDGMMDGDVQPCGEPCSIEEDVNADGTIVVKVSSSTSTSTSLLKKPCAPYNPLNQCQSARPFDSCGVGPNENPQPQPWSLHVLTGSGMDPDTYLETSLLQ